MVEAVSIPPPASRSPNTPGIPLSYRPKHRNQPTPAPEFSQRNASEERSGDDSQADPIADFQNAEQVHHALEQLPLLQREALTLFFLQELTLDEIAVLLGVPIGTVKSRLHYAKQAMHKILSQGENDAH